MRMLPLCLLTILGGCFPARNATVAHRHEPSTEVNVRVYETGRRIVAANPLCGAEAGFQVVGHPELLLFHRDHFCVFVSDSLVQKCTNDDELAAVLCLELGRIVAEKRNLSRMGYADGLVAIPTENALDVGRTSADPIRVAELKLREADKDANNKELTDPVRIARELHKTAGYDANAFTAAEALLKDSNKDREFLKLMNAGAEPVWSR